MIENIAGLLLFCASASTMFMEGTASLSPHKIAVLVGMGFGLFFMIYGFRKLIAEQKMRIEAKKKNP